jgi:hypothetical protein
MKEIKKCFVESAQAAKPRRHRNLSHRHPRFMDKLFREQHSPCLSDGDRGRAEMLKEQPPQLAFPKAEALGQIFNAISFAIKGAFRDKSQRARNCIRSAAP